MLDTSAKIASHIANNLYLFQKRERERDIKPDRRKKDASNNEFSQKNKKLPKNITGEGFNIIE